MGLPYILDVFALFIPPKERRIPMTSSKILLTLFPSVILCIMTCLARTPKTHMIRLALLPIAMISLLHVAYGYKWEGEHKHTINMVFNCLAMIIKIFDLAIPQHCTYKTGERESGSPDRESKLLPPPLSRAWFNDVISLLISARGRGWEFGRGAPIPAPTRPSTRLGFALSTISSALVNIATFDICNSFIQLVPGLDSSEGSTIFRSDIPPLQSAALSIYITLLSGVCVASIINFIYDLISLLAVCVLKQDSKDWPPSMNHPWRASSVRDFWSRWHQFGRRTFLVMGGIPGGYICGRAGRVLGTFIASGLYHELGMYPLNDTWDWRQPLVFSVMGVFVIIEEAWQHITGKRVGGPWGRIWTWSLLVAVFPSLMDSWYLKGIGAAGQMMQRFSPTAHFILPRIRHLLPG